MSVPDVLPPSPPTTNHRHRGSMPLPFKPAMSTPDESPGSFPPSSGTGTRKRVEFSPWPNVADPLSTTPLSEINALKALPPSRDCQTSSRSILKPYIEPIVSISSLDGTDEKQVASPETLEVIAQQLMNNNKGSSLDAYQTLSQIIKIYDEIPEDVNTRSSVAAILRCIKRDLSTTDQTQSSPIDTHLMTQALKVSVILVWSEHFSPLLTDEFRVFIIDRSINALIEHAAPKVIIIHYMHLLAMQNFRSSILATNNRAIKLLEALREITDHVQGKGAIAERLLIYQKMIEQARPIMKSRASLWIREVFLGLSSSVKEIRDKAMSVSARACAAFPSAPTLSTAAREALASTVADKAGTDHTLSALITQRLEKMVAAKDEAIQVPQIWSLGMLLCNSIDTRLESWSLLRDWLKVIQRCFNCSDTSVRSQAFPAWNRFIYMSRPHDASEILASMLAKPIVVQLERTSSNTSGKGLRPAAVSSYCMLLHYAFRPAATHKQYTKMWNEYIVKIMGSSFLSRSTANADLSSRIVMALMWKDHSASRVWNENRAHENTLLDPEDLPAADCKWIRSKTEAILQIFRLLFKHSVWGPSVQHSDQAFVAKAWRHFLKAIRESASKEILPSVETKKSIHYVAQFVRVVSEVSSEIEGRAQLVSKIAVKELGPVLFLEALENDVELRSPAMLGELLKAATTNTVAGQHNPVQSKSSISGTKLPPHLQRCLKLLDQGLLQAYEDHEHDTPNLKSIVNVTTKTLRTISPEMMLSVLDLLQLSLSAVLEDNRNLAKLGSESVLLQSAWMELSDTTAKKFAMLDVSDYVKFDDLLAAMLSSRNMFTKNALLQTWANTLWQETDASYGPKLLQAVTKLQSYAEVHLPGVHHVLGEVDTQVERVVQVDSVTRVALEQRMIAPSKEAITIVELPELIDGETSSETNSNVKNVHDKAAQSRPHHNDSQVDFVPVSEAAAYTHEVESQSLTERQKEVRERQRIEQAVTFPDLRSSPRGRTTRDSRAPSADCEMARKVAAVEGLPSTPTILRQNEILEETELATPTPKAKTKSIGLIEVDILSSPPSILSNRKSGITGLEILSSPAKAQNEADIDMVDLDDAALATDSINAEQDLASKSSLVEASPRLEHQGHENMPRMSQQPTKVIPGDAVMSPGLGSAVFETVQEAGLEIDLAELDKTFRDESSAIDSDLNSAIDEIDEMSASQLSQSLEFHIAEEAKHYEASPELEQVEPNAERRRKRTTSGYADRDRKKRRKRTTIRNETSMSSIASDESYADLGSPSMDNAVVNASPSVITPGRRVLTDQVAAASESDHASGSTTATRRRRTRQKKAEPIPLQVRTRSSIIAAERMASSLPTEVVTWSPSPTQERLTHSGPVTRSPPGDAEDLQLVGEMTEKADLHSNGTRTVKDVDMDRNDPTLEKNVMTALRTALAGLENFNQDQPGSIDLKAIDDLCFKIRYKAQEIGNKQM